MYAAVRTCLSIITVLRIADNDRESIDGVIG